VVTKNSRLETPHDSTALRSHFREAMARMACPVSVVTSLDGSRPHGTTVSAIMSLSMDPEFLLASLNGESDLLEIVKRTGRFGVNLLADGQAQLAMKFATEGAEKFSDVDWRLSEDVPRIVGSYFWLACTLHDTAPYGDHELLVGSITAVEIDPDRKPLVYELRRFVTTALIPTS